MRTSELDNYVEILERVFSFGVYHKYALTFIRDSISQSKFFQAVESNSYSSIVYQIAEDVAKEIYYERKEISFKDVPIYTECLWAAEAYCKIQEHSKLTFEAIFLYIPLDSMFSYFHLYHEMDITRIVEEFDRLYNSRSTLSLLLDKYGYSLKYLSKITNVSYQTLASFNTRRRDIKKCDVQVLKNIANALNTRIETLAELKLEPVEYPH